MSKPKTDLDLAYEAGKAAMSEPPERRTPDACPFDPRDMPQQRKVWLKGFAEALDATPDHSALRKALKEAK